MDEVDLLVKALVMINRNNRGIGSCHLKMKILVITDWVHRRTFSIVAGLEID